MDKNLVVVTSYIMYYDLLQDKINGSFFSKIYKAIEIAELFCSFYSAEEEDNWSGDLDFEETLEAFLNKNI